MTDISGGKPGALWSPWRMGFILKHNEKEGCFLCESAKAEGEEMNRRSVVVKGKKALCCLNIFPYNNGHLLIAPLAHEADLDNLDDATHLEMTKLTILTKKALTLKMRPDGFNLGVNLGRAAGAGVPGHLHLHIVPRWGGDTNFMPIIAGAKAIPQALGELYRILHEALRELNAEKTYTLPPHGKWLDEHYTE